MKSGISTDKWSVRLRYLGALSGALLVFVGRQRSESSVSQNKGADRILAARRSIRVGSISEERNAIGGAMQTEGYYGSRTEMRNMSSLLCRAFAVFVLLLLAPALRGQGVSGRILGTVQDKSGAVVTKVVVTATNQGTGSSVISKTDSNGQYRLENLQPGNYQVKFDAQGFRPYVSDGNVVSVDGATLVDASLEVGSPSETIEVSAAPPLVDTTSSSMGDVISQKEISNLPLNGRIFSQLVQTVRRRDGSSSVTSCRTFFPRSSPTP